MILFNIITVKGKKYNILATSFDEAVELFHRHNMGEAVKTITQVDTEVIV